MPTSNEILQDKITTHQVYILRLAQHEANEANETINATDEAVAAAIALALLQLSPSPTAKNSAAIASLKTKILRIRGPAFEAARDTLLKEARHLAGLEVDWIDRTIKESVNVRISTKPVSDAVLDRIVNLKTYQGKTIAEWFAAELEGDVNRIMQNVVIGVNNGTAPGDIVKGISTATKTTNNNIDTVARTTLNGVANESRDSFFLRNADLISELLWVSTLDGRTSAICRSLDGTTWLITEPHPTPPAHQKCRSSLTPIIDGFGIVGERPFVRNGPGEPWYRKKFESKKARRDWIARNIGQVPADVTYDEWLRKQPRSFVKETLPKWQLREFDKGVKLDKFVGKDLKPLTMKEYEKKTGK
jgi:SPP1 gp7 family putative phage head morphogenesis protein